MTFKQALIRNSLDLMAAEQHDAVCKKPPQSEKSQVAESRDNLGIDKAGICGTYSTPMQSKRPKRIALPLNFPNKQTKETIRRAAKADGRDMNSYIIRAALAKAVEDLKKAAESKIEVVA